METLSRSSSPLFSPIFETVTACAADESNWEELKALLELSFETNKSSKVDPACIERIETIIKEISLAGSLPDQIKLLKLFENYTFFFTDKFFTIVLKQIAISYPEIQRYFYREGLYGNPIISLEGVSSILHFFELEYKFPEGCLSCQTIANLPKLIEEIMLSTELELTKGFVIQSAPHDPHLVPIFITKHGPSVNVLISDSMGHTISMLERNWEMSEIKAIITTFQHQAKYFENLKIYSYALKRQNDNVSCHIFCTLDLKNLYERQLSTDETIFDFLTTYSHPRLITPEIVRDCGLLIYEVELLPPEMMKVTQSYTALKTYASHSPKLEGSMTPCFIRKSPEGAQVFSFQTMDVLNRSVMRAKCISPTSREESKYVDKKRWGFIIQILESHFRNRRCIAIED